ncbi:torsin-1A-like isoform X1 [Anthonomus grandis grandis]|uniref:torsin-1A-like isoform X1 n=1 Tax=Anthonomus grandis grandis TaxID=2921223 RepID=UPI0021669581|nr:torsin-1A-like isoform X1 [Anthonomus grandis grandis]
MSKSYIYNFFYVILILLSCLPTIFSWTFSGLFSSFAKAGYNPYCVTNECCSEAWINFDREGLKRALKENVYGQPLLETAVYALSSHFRQTHHNKALTLSFHGMTGTGKNYVASFIAESMFERGLKSAYVHQFIGRIHFAEQAKVHTYQHELYEKLKNAVAKCPKQLFIFDEVDKMVPEVLNILKPMLDYKLNIDGVDYSQSVFIFLSNTGADVVNEHFHDLYIKEGKERNDMTMADFETFIQRGAFNEQGWLTKGPATYFRHLTRQMLFSRSYLGSAFNFIYKLGGFHHSDAIKNNLIDHYIPFLPLEQKHVEMCIRKEFQIRNVNQPKQELINEVMEIVQWGPEDTKLFSKTGCKRLGAKVGLLVDKHYWHETHRNEL